MSLLDYFRVSRRNSAAIAKERLQILVAHERAERNRPSYLPMMQKELLEVVQKYVNVDQNAITINVEQDDRHEILELNILLPEDQPQPRKVGRG
ncbi:MAG: cell division topological specificity factor MinE [Methylococcus sp.]|nr:MAG: cell division topological specificity factor MinE [Methylococcus sp.]